MARLAYYAHYSGSGHCRYADFAASLVPGGMPVFASRAFSFRYARPVIMTPDEEFNWDLREHYLITLPHYLHYSPVGLEKVRKRSLQILQGIDELGVELVIVDISAEVAALLRASSIPYVYVRLFGDRRDAAHEEAFRGAMGLIAYFPEALESDITPAWVREKTTYLGFKPTEQPTEVSKAIPLPPNSILFIRGFGDARALEEALTQVQRRHPERPLVGVGEFSPQANQLLTTSFGVVDDIQPYLTAAPLVIAACGSNLTAEILRAGRPFVPVPCKRPYAEQTQIAAAVCRAGLGTSLADFLAGTTVSPPQADYLFTDTYREYFTGLAATDDWRSYLTVKLEFVEAPGYDL